MAVGVAAGALMGERYSAECSPATAGPAAAPIAARESAVEIRIRGVMPLQRGIRREVTDLLRQLRGRLWPPSTPAERAAVRRAKERLDRLALYPRPVDTRRVRILHWPWLFRIPGFRRFHGYEFGPLIVIKRPLDQVSDGLIVHELVHVWQSQHRHVRMWLSYLTEGYRDNRHEVEARAAVTATRDPPPPD